MLAAIPDVSSAPLTFDPERHEYFLPNGQRIPGVTEVLRATGISEDFERVALYNSSLRADLDAKRALGIAVHHDCHALDDDDLEWSTVDPRVAPYVNAWWEFRKNHKLIPVERERRVFHPVYLYAGTLDGVFCKKTDGPFIVVDIKTGDVEASACRYQTSAYLAAYRYAQDRALRQHSLKLPKLVGMDRMAVQLCPLSNPPYKVTVYPRHEQARDFQQFQAFLTTYRAQYVRRRAA